jgi:hypothetical protein
MALGSIGVLLGAIVLYFCIRRIFALLRDSELAGLPAADGGEVTLDSIGTCVLHVEQPRLNLAMLRARFVLRDLETGIDVPSSPVLFRTTVSGFATVRWSARYFEIAHAGRYRLVVDGINPDSDLSRIRLIFTRPFGAMLMFLIIGILCASICLIGSIVFTALTATGKI